MKKTVLIILMILSFIQCERHITDPVGPVPLFPAGRSFLGPSEIRITINGAACIPDTVYDHYGGYWLRIRTADLPNSGEIVILYKRIQGELFLFQEIEDQNTEWLRESYYIDSHHDSIRSKAAELTKDLPNNVDKAKRIQQYIIGALEFRHYQDSFLDQASRTFERGYGTCFNFSRLFVALCRAADIPARSVWGIVYGYNNDHIYDYHHQWAEILDETGSWHPVDFTYATSFDLNDIRYLDLLYAPEENTILRDRSLNPIMLGNVKYFNNYPAALTGKLGFELAEDKRPDSMTVRYVYKF